MSLPPSSPKIYHITHVGNLPGIMADGSLHSDAIMNARGGSNAIIGMSSIKERRLHLPVHCHLGTMVGDYVPFYFCPRSVMLYVIHRANHPELTYRGGQGPIVHLEADLHQVEAWATSRSVLWAYSLSNAGALYVDFDTGMDGLDKINWEAVQNSDFRNPDVKESKQAEFLVHESFPWQLITRIGVMSRGVKIQTEQAIQGGSYQPVVAVEPDWYF